VSIVGAEPIGQVHSGGEFRFHFAKPPDADTVEAAAENVHRVITASQGVGRWVRTSNSPIGVTSSLEFVEKGKTQMDKKTKKLIAKLENEMGGQVDVNPLDTLQWSARWLTHDGDVITEGYGCRTKRGALKVLLRDAKHLARAILRVKL